MNEEQMFKSRPNRRTLIRAGALAAVGGLAMRTGNVAHAHHLPTSFATPEYEEALNVQGGVKAMFQSGRAGAIIQVGGEPVHFLLGQYKNWLNANQFSYEIDPAELHTVVAYYASANILNYNDAIWEKYRLGEAHDITDPNTGEPAQRNIFYDSRFGLDASKDPDDPTGFYNDTGMEALQARGGLFLTCHNTVHAHSAAAVASGRAPDGMEASDVAEDIGANLVPGTVMVPAMVAEISKFQTYDYQLVPILSF